MGILNATPDSFYPASRVGVSTDGLDRARSMVDAGAAIIDVGGESTRPGSEPISAQQECERVVPLIAAIRAHSDVAISIDTRKSDVALAALEAGADIINDVSGGRDDPRILSLAAERDVPIVIMHMRGTPATMQDAPSYSDVVSEVRDELAAQVAAACRHGLAKSRIIIDPGIGFGKRYVDNIDLINGIGSLRELGYPLLIGLSRKSFLGAIASEGTEAVAVEDRLAPTLAATVIAAQKGADILRVHDVAETVLALRVVSAFAQRA